MRRSHLLLLLLVVVSLPPVGRMLLAATGQGNFPPRVTSLSNAPEGGWSWFSDPRAVTYNGVLYFGYAQGTNGDVAVRYYDEATGDGAETVLAAAFNQDDHAVPSFLVRDSDHKLMAFYSVHDGTAMFMRVSTNSLDTDPTLSGGFAAAVNLDASLGGSDYTYPYPIQLTGETNDPIYLFYRSIPSGTPTEHDLVYGKSTDGGATWAPAVVVADITQSYWKIAQNGDSRIDFAVTSQHPANGNGSLYHFYYEGGAYFESDDSAMGSVPFGTADMTLVYNGSSVKSWVWDIAIGDDGPVIAYVTFPSDTDHRYNYAAWDGAAWDTNEIVAGGTYIPTAEALPGQGLQVYYSGGLILDKADPSIVYASVQDGSGQWDIRRYTTPDGSTFSETTVIGSGKNVRPVTPVNAERVRVLWMSGTYASYTDYSVGTLGFPR